MTVLQNLKSARSSPEGHLLDSVVCQGTEMDPRVHDGEICYFSRVATPEAGDDVVIELLDGRSIVRRLIGQSSNGVRVSTFNPPRQENISPKSVRGLYRVSMRGDA